MSRVLVVYHPAVEEHDTGRWHPERPDRARLVAEYLEESTLAPLLDWAQPEPCPVAWIERVHTRAYRCFIEESCLRGLSALDQGDTLVSERSYHAALLAAGGALQAVDGVLDEKRFAAFSLMRPPGHHARPGQAMGFCLFNNIAIAAAYAREHYGLERIAIVDWDVHHGNGTQEMFYEDPAVFFASIHQSPLYPNTGFPSESGRGAGDGATLNITVAPGATLQEYRLAMEGHLLPALRAFRPELLLISAGFDAHREDPLAQVNLEDHDFGVLSQYLVQLVREVEARGIVSILEGGYHPRALAHAVEAHLRPLVEAGEKA